VRASAMIGGAFGSPRSRIFRGSEVARDISGTGDDHLVIYGIVLSLAASVCFNLNNLMEKREGDQMARLSARRTGHMVVTLLRSPLWVGGFVLGIFAVALLTLAYSLVSIAVVQSIFGVGIVLLVPASRLWIGEHLGKRELAGLGLIITAVVLVSVSLGGSTAPIDSLSLVRVMFVSGITLVSAGLLFAVLRRSSMDVSIALGASCGLIYGVASIQSKSASVLLEHRGLAHGVIRILESPYPYAFLVASLLGLLAFQAGLQRVRITLAAPMVNIVGSAYTVAIGMLIFDERLPANPALAGLRLGGFAVVLIGTWVLATGTPVGAQPDAVRADTSPVDDPM
jgi:drug/metabolite transporter (DMT)-like permease